MRKNFMRQGCAAHGIVDCGTRICPGHRKALGQAGGYITGAKSDQLLVGVDLVAIAPGEALGSQDATGKAHQQDAGSGFLIDRSGW